MYQIKPELSRDEEAICQRKSRASCFVLITNVRDQEKWSDRRVLEQYKDQSTLEQHFRFIKKPKVTGPIYFGCGDGARSTESSNPTFLQ